MSKHFRQNIQYLSLLTDLKIEKIDRELAEVEQKAEDDLSLMFSQVGSQSNKLPKFAFYKAELVLPKRASLNEIRRKLQNLKNELSFGLATFS